MFQTYTMKDRILLLACLLFIVQGYSQNYVTLYEDCNFRGRSFTLTPGNYKTDDMKIGNDHLSCMNIPNGLKVTIYEHNGFNGRSQTFTSSVACLPADWNDMASSIVVESSLRPGENPNDFITFYNDCNSRGFSRSLGVGTYTANDLGQLKQNISSFNIYGNLRVRVYTTSDNASGYYVNFEQGQPCLPGAYNDKIRSLVIEYKTGNNSGGGNYGDNNNSYCTIYTDCNYRGNSFRLAPGNYNGDKLGMFRYAISSIEIPSDLQAKVYLTSEDLMGSYYTIDASSTCLSTTLNDRIASISIIKRGYGGNGGNGGYDPGRNNDQRVIIYTDENYRGQSVSLLPGTYSSMSQLGFPDKSLSSITVPAGYRVIIYERENFSGKSYTITESKNKFYLSGWNDKTSSIAVYRDR